MHKTVQQKCDQAFNEFLRSQPYEISPESPIFDVVKSFFMKGYSEGGKEGALRTAGLIQKDLEELFPWQ